jgi:hypothetical protein
MEVSQKSTKEFQLPEYKLDVYKQCLEEFERFSYSDPYLDEIRNELSRMLKAKQQKQKA